MMLAEQALFGRAQLVGATVINQEEEAELCRRLRAHGVPLFDDYQSMLTALVGRIDLVLLPTAIHWHTPMVLAALEAGLHVMVEKPVAATLQDIDRMRAAQSLSKRLLAVGFQDLYVPTTHHIKQRLLDGEIGALRRITVTVHWPRAESYYKRNNWAGRLTSDDAWVLDSPTNNAGAHFLMLALFWAGSEAGSAAEATTIQAELYRTQLIESFDTVNARIGTESGVQIDFYATHCGEANRSPEITLTGDRGRITWCYESEYTVDRADAPTEVHALPDPLVTKLHVLENVIGCLRGESQFVVGPDLAREHTRVVNALHEFFPIREIDAPWRLTAGEPGSGFVRLVDIDKAIDEAIVHGRMLSETNLPWAVPAPVVALDNYQCFSGSYTDVRRAAGIRASR